MTLPFQSVLPADISGELTTQLTHLVLISPAVHGSHPDELPPRTLCGLPVDERSSQEIADVECRRCLLAAARFLDYPTFEVTR